MNNGIFWRPLTPCCWHGFIVTRKGSRSLCKSVAVKEKIDSPVARPPIEYRCVSCNSIERGGSRQFPPTKNWEAVADNMIQPEEELAELPSSD